MHDGHFKVHIYTNDFGESTGGALVQYENQLSVNNAITRFDGEYLIIRFLIMKIFIQILIR
jgi:hypothetical protein